MLTMINNAAAQAELNKQVRTIKAKVELYNGSTLLNTFTSADHIKEFSVERAGTGRFFGYGICGKLSLKLIDVSRALTVSAGNSFKVYYGAANDFLSPYPAFSVTEVNRDENTNALSITAYDALYNAGAHTVSELQLTDGYTIAEFATVCASLLGLGIAIDAAASEVFATSYPTGANFGGNETLREALDDVAEATQTIYYLSAGNALTFRRIDKSGTPAMAITKEGYYTLSAKTNRRLAGICSATELGDNVTAELAESGTTEYLRDNAFLELREDIASLLDNALAAVGGLTIGQFNAKWRGNYLLEIGDKVAFTTKDGQTLTSYLLDDTATYNGAYSQATSWQYEDTEQTESNPTNLGDKLNQTFARVDKANRQIDILASEQTAQGEQLAALQINTGSISATVSSLQSATDAALQGQASDIAQLRQDVAASMTSDAVDLRITQALEGGVSSVTTETGFTFNADGLSISRSGSEMQTTVNEDGMSIKRSGEEVLRADNEGVKAEDLHATTYLIIGQNSRFEDYEKDGQPRTGCFWVGPTNA